MKHHQALQTLQQQFNSKKVDSLEDKYYELACDIQDRALKDYHRIYGEQLRDLDANILESRNHIQKVRKFMYP